MGSDYPSNGMSINFFKIRLPNMMMPSQPPTAVAVPQF